MTPEEKQSGIPCALVGTDGNIYALLGRARQALRSCLLYTSCSPVLPITIPAG